MIFVHDILQCYSQHILLISCDAVEVLVEVQNEAGDEGGFPAYMGDCLSLYFVNQQPPIHGPESGHSTKQGVSHGQGNSLWLLRIKDGHKKIQYFPLSMGVAVGGVEAFH